MARELADWIDGYIEYTDGTEPPEKFHQWVAFGILSAALRRKVWMNRGRYKLYPNIYVLLVSESAKTRKSTAIDLGIDLLQKTDLRVYSLHGKLTPEGLVKHMNRMTVIKGDNGSGEVINDSHILIHADELATLFGYDKTQASRMAILLTELYNSKTLYQHVTAGEGIVEVHNLYTTIIAATDPRNLKVLPEDAVGGLMGRLVVVSASKIKRAIAWGDLDDKGEAIDFTKIAALEDRLVKDLNKIGELEGEMRVTPAGRSLFTTWYKKHVTQEVSDPRTDAFHARCHDTALKLSMLISIAKSNNMVVDEPEVAAGLAIIEAQLPEFSRIISWAGNSDFSQLRAKFIDLLRRVGGLAYKKRMMRAMGLKIEDYESLEKTLVTEGTLEMRRNQGDYLYRLIDDKEVSSVKTN